MNRWSRHSGNGGTHRQMGYGAGVTNRHKLRQPSETQLSFHESTKRVSAQVTGSKEVKAMTKEISTPPTALTGYKPLHRGHHLIGPQTAQDAHPLQGDELVPAARQRLAVRRHAVEDGPPGRWR